MPPLDGRARAALPDSAFAYIDRQGRRRLPIHDPAHVRNALARFEQTAFEDEAARERARQRLLRAARKYDVSTIGFFDGQLRKERRQGERAAKEARIARLPSGVVTFLLADVEGSTRLAQRFGDGWPALLGSVWHSLRRAVQGARGVELDIRGDEYFAVFSRPVDALTAAARAQLAIGKQKWPERGEVRVRIGLHTGRPTIADAAYVGIVVHTVARVCSAGHGGQILLSSAMQEVLANALPEGMSLRDLGRYSLAGLPRAEALFQLQATGLIADFPRLRVRLAPGRSLRPPVAVVRERVASTTD